MKGPHIDWAAISPLVALTVGACLVLMAGLLRPAFVRTTLVPGLTIVTLGASKGEPLANGVANGPRVSES